jgi:hypothetical protein
MDIGNGVLGEFHFFREWQSFAGGIWGGISEQSPFQVLYSDDMDRSLSFRKKVFLGKRTATPDPARAAMVSCRRIRTPGNRVVSSGINQYV